MVMIVRGPLIDAATDGKLSKGDHEPEVKQLSLQERRGRAKEDANRRDSCWGGVRRG